MKWYFFSVLQKWPRTSIWSKHQRSFVFNAVMAKFKYQSMDFYEPIFTIRKGYILTVTIFFEIIWAKSKNFNLSKNSKSKPAKITKMEIFTITCSFQNQAWNISPMLFLVWCLNVLTLLIQFNWWVFFFLMVKQMQVGFMHQNYFGSNWLKRFHQCWWRMLETKCVGDNYKMLATVSVNLVTSIHHLFTLASGTNIQKMLPTSKNSHQHHH